MQAVSHLHVVLCSVISQALADLTGGIPLRLGFDDEQVRKDIKSGALWKSVLGYLKSGYLLGAGTPSGKDTVEDASPTGIVQGHAYVPLSMFGVYVCLRARYSLVFFLLFPHRYSFLDAQEVDGFKLVQLRNPWGQFEWTGDWSDADTTHWTERIRKKYVLSGCLCLDTTKLKKKN